MNDGHPPNAARPSPETSGGRFGTELAPLVVTATGERLHRLRWFRSAWQRSGAVTGHARYVSSDRNTWEAVVKLPVPPKELRSLRLLQRPAGDPAEAVPRLFASDERLDGHDLAWVVMEKLGHGPLDVSWEGREVDLLVDAAARFHASARLAMPDAGSSHEAWPAVVRRARRAVQDHGVPEDQRWNTALRALQKRLSHLLARWEARPQEHLCHGDLHFGNAMTRSTSPMGPALLFDLGEVHRGHWVEDAVYFEHLFWSRPNRLAHRPVVKRIAERLKAYGLRLDPTWPELAEIRRALVAAEAPNSPIEGAPHHRRAALSVLESSLARLGVR